MDAFDELTEVGTTGRAAARLTGMSRATMARRATTIDDSGGSVAEPDRDRGEPVNKLDDVEREQVLAVLNSDRFVDAAPTQVYATLLAEGCYLCSISTMYRILGANQQVKERRRLAKHRSKAIPELVATAPRQVYTWDITKLAGPQRGVYYDAYVMINIYSRYIVGVHVHTHESGPLAKNMMCEVFGVHGIPQVVHADRGTSMTSKTVTELLADLNVTRSHSRPRVSNDNPFSESWFAYAWSRDAVPVVDVGARAMSVLPDLAEGPLAELMIPVMVMSPRPDLLNRAKVFLDQWQRAGVLRRTIIVINPQVPDVDDHALREPLVTAVSGQVAGVVASEYDPVLGSGRALDQSAQQVLSPSTVAAVTELIAATSSSN